eukprot:TRINITY_DN3560_c0_g4_i1.p1 TRINITY_DN3560_c0_g4~~TRINITY_DN3560_c0_g4_i1.p1  ORF type:complete len:1776 (+),score=407.01 TRINITY_DN3560_c0_g4_i1:47-5374(+)
MPVVHVIVRDASCLLESARGELAFACWLAPTSPLQALLDRARARAAGAGQPSAGPRPLSLALHRAGAVPRALEPSVTVDAAGIRSGDEVHVSAAEPLVYRSARSPSGPGTGFADTPTPPSTSPVRARYLPPPPPTSPSLLGSSFASPPRRPVPTTRWAPRTPPLPSPVPDVQASTPPRVFPLLTPTTAVVADAHPVNDGPVSQVHRTPHVPLQAFPAEPHPSFGMQELEEPPIIRPTKAPGGSRPVWVRIRGGERFDPRNFVVSVAHRLKIDPRRVDLYHLSRDTVDSHGRRTGPAPAGESNRKFVFPKPRYDKTEKRFALRPSPFTHEHGAMMVRLRFTGREDESDAIAATLLRRCLDSADILHKSVPGIEHAAFCTLAAATPSEPRAEHVDPERPLQLSVAVPDLGFYAGFRRAELKLPVLSHSLSAEAVHQWSVYHRWPNALPDIDAPWALCGALRDARKLRWLPLRPKPPKPFDEWGDSFEQGEMWTGVKSPLLRDTQFPSVTPPPSPRAPAQTLWPDDSHPMHGCANCESRKPRSKEQIGKESKRPPDAGDAQRLWVQVCTGEEQVPTPPETPLWKRHRRRKKAGQGAEEEGEDGDGGGGDAAEGGGGGGDGGGGGGGGGGAVGPDDIVFLGAWARMMARPESPPSKQDLAEFRRAKATISRLATRPYDPKRAAGPPKGGYDGGRRGKKSKVELIPDPQTGIKVTMKPPGHDKPMLAAISEVTKEFVRMEFVDKKNVGRVDVPMDYYREQQAAAAGAAGGGESAAAAAAPEAEAGKEGEEESGAAKAAKGGDKKGGDKKAAGGDDRAGAADKKKPASTTRGLPWPTALATLWDLAAAQAAASRRRQQYRSQGRHSAAQMSAQPLRDGDAQQHVEGRRRVLMKEEAERRMTERDFEDGRVRLLPTQREWEGVHRAHHRQLNQRRVFESKEDDARLGLERAERSAANALSRVIRVMDMEYAWRVSLWLHWDEFTVRSWLLWTLIEILEEREPVERNLVRTEESAAWKMLKKGGKGEKKVFKLDVPEPATGVKICIIPPGKDYVAPGTISECTPDKVRVEFVDKRDLGRMDVPMDYYKQQRAKFEAEQKAAGAAAQEDEEEDQEAKLAREQAARAKRYRVEQMLLLADEVEPMIHVWKGWEKPPRDDDGIVEVEKVLRAVNREIVGPRSHRYFLADPQYWPAFEDMTRKGGKALLVLPSSAEEVVSEYRVQAKWEGIQEGVLKRCAQMDREAGLVQGGAGAKHAADDSDSELEPAAAAPTPMPRDPPAAAALTPVPAAGLRGLTSSPDVFGGGDDGAIWRDPYQSAGDDIWRSRQPATVVAAHAAPPPPPPPVPPPVVGDPTVVTVTLDMDIADFRGRDFRDGVADSVGLRPGNIEVLSVRRGSVIVQMRVVGLPPDAAARAAAEIAARANDPADRMHRDFRDRQCGRIVSAQRGEAGGGPERGVPHERPDAGGMRAAEEEGEAEEEECDEEDEEEEAETADGRQDTLTEEEGIEIGAADDMLSVPHSCFDRRRSRAAASARSGHRLTVSMSDAPPATASDVPPDSASASGSSSAPTTSKRRTRASWAGDSRQSRKPPAGGGGGGNSQSASAASDGNSFTDENWAGLVQPPTPSERTGRTTPTSQGGGRVTVSSSTVPHSDFVPPPSPRGRYTGSPRRRVMRQGRLATSPAPAAVRGRYAGPRGREGGQQALQRWRPPQQKPGPGTPRHAVRPPSRGGVPSRPAAPIDQQYTELSEEVRILHQRLAARDEEAKRLEQRRLALEREIGLARRSG